MSNPSEPRLNTPTERALYRDCTTFKAERDHYREALTDIRAELSHGLTANWEYIERRFAEVLDA